MPTILWLILSLCESRIFSLRLVRGSFHLLQIRVSRFSPLNHSMETTNDYLSNKTQITFHSFVIRFNIKFSTILSQLVVEYLLRTTLYLVDSGVSSGTAGLTQHWAGADCLWKSSTHFDSIDAIKCLWLFRATSRLHRWLLIPSTDQIDSLNLSNAQPHFPFGNKSIVTQKQWKPPLKINDLFFPFQTRPGEIHKCLITSLNTATPIHSSSSSSNVTKTLSAN